MNRNDWNYILLRETVLKPFTVYNIPCEIIETAEKQLLPCMT